MRPWGVLATASIWLVLSLSLWATGSRPAVIVLAGIVIVGAALVVSVVDVARDIGDTGWSRPRITNRPINDDQRVTLLDIGHTEELRRHARDLGAEVTELELSSQFRCNGSDGYLAWLDNILDIRGTANPTRDTTSTPGAKAAPASPSWTPA